MNNNQRTMLIVDDENDICEFLHKYFSDRGFKTVTADSYEGALTNFKEHDPDIIILDIEFPGDREGGIKVLKEIMKSDGSKKVIMATAREDDQTITRARDLGAVDYIVKPISLEYLETTVSAKIEELLS